jgi:hypothetical protein
MLSSLRLHRNRLVHSARAGEDAGEIAFLIKFFVDPHLCRLIRNDFRIGGFDEYARQLASPADVGALEDLHDRVGRLLRMRRRWERDEKSDVQK